jgi:hypothetical protein
MKKLLLLIVIVATSAHAQIKTDAEAIEAVRLAAQRLGVAADFDPSKASVEPNADNLHYVVETDQVTCYVRSSDGRVMQLKRTELSLDRTRTQNDNPKWSETKLSAKAKSLVETLGPLPPDYRVWTQVPDGYDVYFFFEAAANGIDAQTGTGMAVMDPGTGEFLWVSNYSQDFEFDSPEGVLSEAELFARGRFAAEAYVRSLGPEAMKRQLPLQEPPSGGKLYYGWTAKERRNGKQVRILASMIRFGNVTVTIDAKTGELLFGAMSGKSSPKQPRRDTTNSGEKRADDKVQGPNLPVIGGVMVAVGLGVAALVRRRRG